MGKHTKEESKSSKIKIYSDKTYFLVRQRIYEMQEDMSFAESALSSNCSFFYGTVLFVLLVLVILIGLFAMRSISLVVWYIILLITMMKTRKLMIEDKMICKNINALKDFAVEVAENNNLNCTCDDEYQMSMFDYAKPSALHKRNVCRTIVAFLLSYPFIFNCLYVFYREYIEWELGVDTYSPLSGKSAFISMFDFNFYKLMFTSIAKNFNEFFIEKTTNDGTGIAVISAILLFYIVFHYILYIIVQRNVYVKHNYKFARKFDENSFIITEDETKRTHTLKEITSYRWINQTR